MKNSNIPLFSFTLIFCLILASCKCNIIQEPCYTGLFIEIRKWDTSCNTRDGQIRIIASGGNKPYTYKWKHDPNLPSDSYDIADLKSGLYEVTITDSDNNQTISQIIIN